LVSHEFYYVDRTRVAVILFKYLSMDSGEPSTSRSKERESGRATHDEERRGDLRRDRDDQVRRTGSLA